DDVLANAFGKIFLLALAGDVDEGENGDGGAIERGLMLAQRLRGGHRRCGGLKLRQLAARLCGGGSTDVADEAKALSRESADDRLILTAIADGFPRGVDAAGQSRFGDDAAVPDGLHQIVLGDDAVAVLDQVDQQIEHLRLYSDIFATPR